MALAATGLAIGWRRWRAETLLLAVFPLAYLALLLPKAVYVERLSVPLLPFLSLFAALGSLALVERVGPASLRPVCLAILMALAVAQPVSYDLQHNRLLTQADTRVLANEWVQANLPANSRLRVENYSLLDLSSEHLAHTPNADNLKIEGLPIGRAVEQLQRAAEGEADYFVSDSFSQGELHSPQPRWQDLMNRYQRAYQNLTEHAQLVKEFSPGVGGRDVPYSPENAFTPFWNLEQFERPGPTVQVYRVAQRDLGPR